MAVAPAARWQQAEISDGRKPNWWGPMMVTASCRAWETLVGRIVLFLLEMVILQVS